MPDELIENVARILCRASVYQHAKCPICNGVKCTLWETFVVEATHVTNYLKKELTRDKK